MKVCSLIIISPDDPNIWKIQVTRQAVLILVIAFVLSFCVAAAMAYGLETNDGFDAEYSRLRKENLNLSIETKNAALRMRRLNAAVSDMERRSERIGRLMQQD